MPDLRRTIDIIFNGIDQTGKGSDSALSNINKVTSNIQSSVSALSNVTKEVLKFEAAAVTAGVALTAFSVKVASDFDTAFREIATLINIPLEGLGQFREEIKEYSKDSTQSLDQITQSIYSSISAGIDYKDSIGVVSQAEKLAVASKAGLNDTLLVLVSSLNAYGLKADSAAQFSDALFTAVEKGQLTLPELSASLAQVTGTASNVGVSFDELLASIAAITSSGAKVSQSITLVKAVLTNILKPSEKAKKVSAELGLEFGLQAVKAKGLSGFLKDLIDKTGGSQQKMLELFESSEAVNAIFTLTGKSSDKFTEALDAMAKKTGAVNAAFKKMEDSAGLSLQNLTNNFKSVLISIGDPLLDEFGGITAALSAIFNAVDDSVKGGALQEFVGSIEDIGQAIQATLEEVARNLPAALNSADYSEFSEGLQVLKDSINDLFGGADLTSVDGLKNIIEGVGTAFNTLATFTAGVGTALSPVIELLIDAVKWFNDLSNGSKELLGSIGGIAIVIDSLAPSIFALSVAYLALNAANISLKSGLIGLTKIAGKAGLAGAIGILTFEFGKWIDLNDRFVPGVDTLGTKLYELVDAFSKVSDAEKQALAIQQADEAIQKRKVDSIRENIKAINDLIKSKSQGADTDEIVKQRGDALVKSFNDQKIAYDSVTGVVSNLAKKQGDLVDVSGDYVKAIKDEDGKIVGYSQALTNVGVSLDKVADKTKNAVSKSDALLIKMEEIASNERIKSLEFSIELDIAKVQANAEEIKATFQNLDTIFISTGDVISAALGPLANFKGVSAFDAAFKVLKDQLEKENAIRKVAADDAHQLRLKQIENLKARNESLERGDGLFTIDGSGLAPHLEAFMFEVIKMVRLRITEEQSDLLVAVN